MWAGDLFISFRENDIAKENELAKHASKINLQSIKSIYKKRRKQGMTPFIVAILHDDIALCEQLIEEGIDFCQQDTTSKFDEATFTEFNLAAAMLIEIGPYSNVFTDFKKTTPMFWAIKCGKVGLVEKLIHSGHKINGLVEKLAGMPALSYAILSKNTPVVKHLLSIESCDIHQNSFLRLKPLDIAVRTGHADFVKLLLKRGENVNCTNHELSPLSQAVFLDDILMVKFILSEGANINGLETANTVPPLVLAILRGHFEIASFLILKGANINFKDCIDNTALHLLLPNMKMPKAIKVAQLLIDRGAMSNVANKKGKIPLLQVIFAGEAELFHIFLSSPFNLNSMLNLEPKATYLHVAVAPPNIFGQKNLDDVNTKDYWKKRCSIVQTLIDKGANVNKQSGDGRTSIHFAAESGSAKLVKLLVASKVDVNKLSEKGKVALHHAAYNGSVEVVKCLLESGAEVNIRDNDGLTPLDFGLMNNARSNYDTVKLLIEYGADIYSHSATKQLATYDISIAMIRSDLLQLFWKQGCLYDITIFPPTKNFLASVKSFFHSLGLEDTISQALDKRLNKRNYKHVTDLMNAQNRFITGVVKNNVKIVFGALQNGAQVGGGSVKVPFPLHFVAKRGFTEVAQVLLSKGVTPNTVDSEGNTPVDLAVQFGHIKMYKTLLRFGACYKKAGFDTSIFQKQGNKLNYELYVSIKRAFTDVKQGRQRILERLNKYVMLKKWDVYHPLVNCVDEKGRTLMQVAMDRGHTDIVHKLMEYRLQSPETDDLQCN